MSTKFSDGLVSSDWLGRNLGEDNLRIYDCTVFLGVDGDNRVMARGGRPEYENAHIPGAAFIDLLGELTAQKGNVGFLAASPETFSRVLSTAGLGNEHRAVLYSSDAVMWATRMWWMLRANGFTNAAVLDGGLQRWIAEGRPVARGNEKYPAANFSANPDPARWADKNEVLAEIGNSAVCTINALSNGTYLGIDEQTPFEKAAYGRPGRIKGSLSVPYSRLLTEEGSFAPADELRRVLDEVGAYDRERVIAYCGGGIASTMTALALHLTGYDDVAVYDGSLHEWGNDPSLPMETG